jgi:RNA polymerase sigma-70 factor (ECF subfamily)
VNDALLEVLLDRMREGDSQAAEQVFLAYEPQLRLLVRRQLSRRLRAKFDSLDVVQSVWVHVLRDFRESGCRIASPAHLRNFLVRVTCNCLTDRLRHYRTALEREQPIGQGEVPNLPASAGPRPSEVAVANDLWESMLASCPPEHHEVLRLKRQGLPLAVIASRTGLHEDSVRRILRKLARQLACSSDEPTA